MYALLNIFNVPPAVYREWCARQRGQTGTFSDEADGDAAGSAGAASTAASSGGLTRRKSVTAAAEADVDSKLKHARKSLRRAKRRQVGGVFVVAGVEEVVIVVAAGVGGVGENKMFSWCPHSERREAMSSQRLAVLLSFTGLA